MTLMALEIPDDPGKAARWLEGQLLGASLGGLVEELNVADDTVGAGGVVWSEMKWQARV